MIGECLLCSKISNCNDTGIERVMTGYTCPLFTPIVEAVYEARIDMIRKYGSVVAIEAMIQDTPAQNLEEDNE